MDHATERTPEALKAEARGLQDALRPLLGITALGELTGEEAGRKEKIEARLRELRAQAEGIAATRREAHAERKRGAREAEERKIRDAEASSTTAHLAAFVREEVVRYRSQEYHRVGLGPSGRTGRVELPAALVAQTANEVEDLLGATRVCADDYHRQAWYRQNFLAEVVDGTYDEVCERYLGVPARSVRDTAADRALGVHLEDGRLAPGPPPAEPRVTSPTPGTPHQDFGTPAAPSPQLR